MEVFYNPFLSYEGESCVTEKNYFSTLYLFDSKPNFSEAIVVIDSSRNR